MITIWWFHWEVTVTIAHLVMNKREQRQWSHFVIITWYLENTLRSHHDHFIVINHQMTSQWIHMLILKWSTFRKLYGEVTVIAALLHVTRWFHFAVTWGLFMKQISLWFYVGATRWRLNESDKVNKHNKVTKWLVRKQESLWFLKESPNDGHWE